jgi:hypothetical protein
LAGIDKGAFVSEKNVGRGGYVLSVLIIILGVVCAAGVLIHSFRTWDDGVTRVLIPGEHTLKLTEAGSYTIFHEYRSQHNGAVFSNPEGVPGLVCVVRDSSGKSLPIKPPLGTQTYSLGSYSGQAIFTFEVDFPGTYFLEAHYPEIASDKPQAMLSIGDNIVSTILFAVFGSLGIGIGSFAVATIVFVITLIRRMKNAGEA